MSWSKIAELDNHFLRESGEGIEEIVLSEQAFDCLLRDVAVRRNLDYVDLQDETGNEPTNMKFHTQSGELIISRSNKLEIMRIEDQIQGLEQKLQRLKTRNF